MRTNELTGAALDWAVAQCEVGADFIGEIDDPHFYSTDWAQGGPIIEREGITILSTESHEWCATIGELYYEDDNPRSPTPLIAAMRCYVASKLGDEVKIPSELTSEVTPC
jgi:hypothetical protein